MTLVNKAKEFATKKHEGQFRRDGITPYIKHPEAVANLLDLDIHKAVAWLHDTIEDTDTTYIELAETFGDDIAFNVLKLTHRKGESYEGYIRRVRNEGLAKIIKIADIVSNLSDNPTEKQKRKYMKAINILSEEK